MNGGGLQSLFATFNRAGVYVFEAGEPGVLKGPGQHDTLERGVTSGILSRPPLTLPTPDQFAAGTYSETPLSIGEYRWAK